MWHNTQNRVWNARPVKNMTIFYELTEYISNCRNIVRHLKKHGDNLKFETCTLRTKSDLNNIGENCTLFDGITIQFKNTTRYPYDFTLINQ